MKNLSLLSDSYFQYIREEIEDFKAPLRIPSVVWNQQRNSSMRSGARNRGGRGSINPRVTRSIVSIGRVRASSSKVARERSLSTGRDSRPLVSHPDYARILSHGFFAADPFSSIAISIEASIDWKSARFREIVPRNIVLDYYRWRIWNIW